MCDKVESETHMRPSNWKERIMHLYPARTPLINFLAEGYEYTTYEGGSWFTLDVNVPEWEVVTALHHNCVQGDSSDHTVLNGVQIHSVKFPNGRIWDSYFKDFRPTKRK